MASVLEEKDAIRELMARYCFYIDLGEYDDWLDLFTDDGVFDLGAMGRFQGKDKLRGFLKSLPLGDDGKPALRHCVTNTIIDVQGNRATARSYVVVAQSKPELGLSVVGRYEDRIIKDGDTWRFQERRVWLDFMGRR